MKWLKKIINNIGRVELWKREEINIKLKFLELLVTISALFSIVRINEGALLTGLAFMMFGAILYYIVVGLATLGALGITYERILVISGGILISGGFSSTLSTMLGNVLRFNVVVWWTYYVTLSILILLAMTLTFTPEAQ